MALSQAKRRSNDKYIAEHYQRIYVSYPKEYAEKIKARATEKGESVAGYVKGALDARMQREDREQELAEILGE